MTININESIRKIMGWCPNASALAAGPSPYIYSIDLNTGNLLWKGGKGGIAHWPG